MTNQQKIDNQERKNTNTGKPGDPLTKPCQLKNIDDIAAACSTCGNCLYACPVYNAEWTEPNSPRGKINIIKALQDGTLESSALNKKFLYQCVLCGSCQDICTQGVKFTDMMVEYRNKAAQGKKIPFIKKIILYFYQSILFKKFVWVVDWFAKTPLKKKFLIPNRRKGKLETTPVPKNGQQEEYDILFFPGCVLTHFYPELTEKTVRFLKKKGYSVVIPKGLECCGFPFITQGWKEKFDQLKKNNQAKFSSFKFKHLLTPCGTCVMGLKDYYDLEGVEIIELADFFYKYINDAQVNLEQFKKSSDAGGTGKITWHDPCHDLKGLGIGKEPRHFMKQLGEDFVDDKSALCCGFGGVFSVGFPSTSKKIFNRKKDKLDELGADTVVTSCPGCYLQLRENLPHNVKFFIDLFE